MAVKMTWPLHLESSTVLAACHQWRGGNFSWSNIFIRSQLQPVQAHSCQISRQTSRIAEEVQQQESTQQSSRTSILLNTLTRSCEVFKLSEEGCCGRTAEPKTQLLSFAERRIVKTVVLVIDIKNKATSGNLPDAAMK